MKGYSAQDLDVYLKRDWVLEELKKYPNDEHFTSHRWLMEMPAKRMIYADVYGGLFKEKDKRILDVGGGFCGLSRVLKDSHNYTLVDIMAHDDHEKIRAIESEGGTFWVNDDWAEFEPDGEYDYVIANDLFPNVDQRLAEFIKKFNPVAEKIIIILTCYDADRFYKVKRLDADEILTIRPWTSTMTSLVLRECLNDTNITLEPDYGGTPLFKNGRRVYKIVL